jgi:hypothetical protein
MNQPSKPRLLLFAFGDFAFNLYWQSVMLYLLFYYTDALVLPIGVAATTYMIASIWDGIANFITGMLVDRWHQRSRGGMRFRTNDILVAEPLSSRYCRGDIIRSIDRHSRFPGPSCILGDFVPYTRAG